jgi:hypothetical protein
MPENWEVLAVAGLRLCEARARDLAPYIDPVPDDGRSRLELCSAMVAPRARSDLCRAIVTSRVMARVTAGGQTFLGVQLEPFVADDIDWAESRPLRALEFGHGERRTIELIEVCSDQVTQLIDQLCVQEAQAMIRPPIMALYDKRRRRISRFRDYQRRVRRWISFEEIVDHLSRSVWGEAPDESRRTEATKHLRDAVLAGEFERDGKPLVLCLDPDRPVSPGSLRADRVGPDLLQFKRYGPKQSPEEPVGRNIFMCWVPRDLARRWFKRRNLPWPETFDPIAGRGGGEDGWPRAADEFAKAFIDREEREGRVPRQEHAVAWWAKLGRVGERDKLRDAFNAEMTHRGKRVAPGRPKKAIK